MEKLEDWKNFTKKELEHHYSPSQWSPYSSGDEIIAKYVQKVEFDIDQERQKIPWRSVTAQDRPIMDIYGEDLPKDSPIVVYVHGGYWQELSKDLVGGLMGPLYAKRIVTAVLSYTIAPEGTLPRMIKQVSEGIAECLQIADYRGSKGVVVVGWSAGAQLVMQALASDDISTSVTKGLNSKKQHHLKGIIGISGVYDLRPLVDTYVNSPLHLSSDEAWKLSPLNTANLLPLRNKIPSNTPILLATAQYDSPHFKLQSDTYVKGLVAVGFPGAVRHEVDDADHFLIVSELSDAKNRFVKKIIEMAKG